MEQRTEFALKALKTENFRALCQEYGISTKTGYKWRERFLSRGLEVLSKVVYEKQAHPRLNWASLTCKLMVRWGQNAPLRSRSNPP